MPPGTTGCNASERVGLMSKKIKPLRVPVTQGLKDIYAMDMHLPYQAACEGRFSVTAFGRLAAAISVVRTALVTKHARIPDTAVPTLDKAIGVLSTIRTRGDTTNVWEITADERPAILAGIEVAEACIGVLDVSLLAQTAVLLQEQLALEQE